MDNNRLPKKILDWDLSVNGNTWSSEIKSILYRIGENEAFNTRQTVRTNSCWALLHEQYCNNWKVEIANKPKLRTYVKFKVNYNVEQYVTSFMSKCQRSFLAQLRCGILPLEIETGRWYGIKLEDRKCKVCKNDSIETEVHFLFYCTMYHDNRSRFYNTISENVPNFIQCNDSQKLQLCMEKENVILFSRYLKQIVSKRKDILYA